MSASQSRRDATKDRAPRHRAGQKGIAVPQALAMLEPVAVRTVNETVYEALRNELMSGSFAAGETLKIQDVAATLKVSTMPVREAFARLVSERALETMPNRSVRVPPLSRGRLDDLAATRLLVEGEALRRAIPNLTAGAIDELSTLTDAYDEALQAAGEALPRTAADLNHAFHSRLYSAARSTVLMPIIESLWLQSGPYVRAAAEIYRSRGGLMATDHHRAIITALRNAEPAAAVDALAADIDFAFALLRAEFSGGRP